MQTTKPSAKQTLVKKLVIHAPNVHGGGGAVLLKMLLSVLVDIPCVLQVDSRFVLPENCPTSIEVIRVKPSLLQRFVAERRLRKFSKTANAVLCFGNLPPLFKLHKDAVVFLQSRYSLGAPLSLLTFKLQLRIKLERLWLRWCYKNAAQYWVQTETMRQMALGTFLKNCEIRVKPFFDRQLPKKTDAVSKKPSGVFRFIYPASNEGHKNHLHLVKAWVLLAEVGHYPELQLTLDAKQESLLRAIVERKKLNIKFLGSLAHQELLYIYQSVDALIFPSLFESYGLPLLEAASVDLPIIASERDYVRDLVEPNQTFDPLSEVSIMRSVMRFMQQKISRAEILSPQVFIKQLLNREISE